MTRVSSLQSRPFPSSHSASEPRGGSRQRVTSGGRFLLSGDAIEHRCQAVEISASGIALRASVKVRVGERVICYLDEIGRVEGRVTQLSDDGFAVDITSSPMRRARMAEQLASKDGRPQGSAAQRLHDRLEPTQTRVVIRTPEGRHIAANILNLSRSGAALTCPVALSEGTEVSVGRRPAVVIRAAQRLLAVEFKTPIADVEFTADIVL